MQTNQYRNRRNRLSQTTELDYIREIMYDYSENMYYYNSNIRLMMEYMRSLNETNRYNQIFTNHQSRYRQGQRYSSQNSTTTPSRQHTGSILSLFQNAFSQFPILRENNVFEDVVIRPTNLQIDNAIETLIYDISGENTYIESRYCPITMEEFSQGCELSRIKHCGHIFSKQALRNWFSSNVRCPICRYDIRETPIHISNSDQLNEDILDQIPLENDIPSTSTSNNTIINETSNNTQNRNNWTNITNILRTFIQQELQGNPTTAELLYTIDIPYLSNDFSGNWIE
jgi:hypothetical protein